MSLLALVSWLDADGVRTGPWNRPVPSEAEAAELIRRDIAAGRRAGGTDIRGGVMNDMDGRVVARVRAR